MTSKLIGLTKKHKNGYEYLSLFEFPDENIENVINDSILEKVNQAQFLLGKLSGITILLPDVDYFIGSFVMKDAVSSSQIEGTKATMIEALEYVADPSAEEDTDADDITHYIKALNHGLRRTEKDNFPFSLRFIKELHKELMDGARSTHFASPGEFRKTQNWIGGRNLMEASFVPPCPEELIENLSDFEQFLHKPFIHPIVDAGLMHAQFESIHPFLDGNGRTGRLLITFYLINRQVLELPVLFLSTFFKKNQKVYYEKLNSYHNGHVDEWLEFFLDAVIETANDAIELSKEITDLRGADLVKISALSKRTSEIATQVIQRLYAKPIVSSATMREWIGQTRAGVSKFIKNLEDIGILTLHRKGVGTRPSLYAHSEYLKIFSDK